MLGKIGEISPSEVVIEGHEEFSTECFLSGTMTDTEKRLFQFVTDIESEMEKLAEVDEKQKDKNTRTMKKDAYLKLVYRMISLGELKELIRMLMFFSIRENNWDVAQNFQQFLIGGGGKLAWTKRIKESGNEFINN